jgi:hypothetical protein
MSNVSFSLLLFFTTIGCFSFSAHTAEPAKRLALLEYAQTFIIKSENYASYAAAIKDPHIAEKWIKSLEKKTAGLEPCDYVTLVKEIVNCFLSALKNMEAGLFLELSDDVFTEETFSLTDKERLTIWHKRKHTRTYRMTTPLEDAHQEKKLKPQD